MVGAIIASSGSASHPFAILIGFFALFGSLFYLSHLQATKRTKNLATVAESLSLAFSQEWPLPFRNAVGSLDLSS